MSVGIWMVPVVLANLVVILWVATWLERRLVTVPAVDAELPRPAALDTAFTDAAAGPEPLGTVDRSLHHAISARPAATDEEQLAVLEAHGK